jgi:uncharacterized membrane protein
MKKISLYVMILFYAGAGINHFIRPEFYLQIIPGWLPQHKALVLISGIAEILCAVLLLFPKTIRAGAWCTIALLIAIFPANIQMLLNYSRNKNPMLWIALIRLPIQLLLIWWAYSFTRPIRSAGEGLMSKSYFK